MLGGIRVIIVSGSGQHPVLLERPNSSRTHLADNSPTIARPVVHPDNVQQRFQRPLLRRVVERVQEVGHH